MSKPITRSNPASWLARTMPTMPPAGPERDAVLAVKSARVGQPAVRLHELQVHVRHLAGHLVDVAAQDRRQVGVDHRGVAACDQFHHRADLVRYRYLREADFARDARRRRFMFGEPVAVHEDDGQRTQAPVEHRLQRSARGRFIDRAQHLAVGADPLVDLDDCGIQQLGQHDVAVEQARTVLVGDPQGVAEAARDGQRGRLAFALEQRVGRHRGAHLDRFDLRDRDRFAGAQPEQVADAGHRGVGVAFGVFRQQLVGRQRAIRPARDDVGKSAAAINPELPIHAISLL
jgi:hypothetical protein